MAKQSEKKKHETEWLMQLLHCLKKLLSVSVLYKPNQEAKSPISYTKQILSLCKILFQDYIFRLNTTK